MGPTPPSLFELLAFLLRIDGAFNQREGRPVEFVDLDVDLGAEPAMPVLEVVLLGHLSLNEDQ
jgi:hypothetical protein